MTIENTPGAEQAETAEQPAPRRRARRAASAPATTVGGATGETSAPPAPEPDVRTEPGTGAAEEPTPTRRTRRKAAQPVEDAPSPAGAADDGASKPARRSRRATSNGATAEGATPESPAGEGTGSGPADEAGAATGTSARTSRRRRTERSAAPAEDTVRDDRTDGSNQDGRPEETGERAGGAPVTEAEAGPATRGRGRARRSTSASAAPDAAQPALDVMAELGDRVSATAQEPTADESPRTSPTALLFQAPEPSRTRRRRAQAPAGPPKPVDDEDGTEQEEPSADAVEPDERTPDDDGAVDAQGGEDTGSDETGSEDTEDEDEDAETSDRESEGGRRRRRRRGGRGRRSRAGSDRSEDDTEETASEATEPSTDGRGEESGENEGEDEGDGESGSSRRRRRRRRSGGGGGGGQADEGAGRSRSRSGRTASDEVTALKGSTRLEAKRQRRREGRDAGRRRTVVTEAEFLARRESVERSMIVRESGGRVQIAVLEDDVLVEHFVSRSAQNAQSSMAGNVYLGRVQNVLPSMEAAFVDVGKGRNAVLYAGEVNWDAAGLEGQPRRIEQALKSGDSVLVQVTKDPIGHKGARLTSQITLAGRYLVYVPGGGMTGISRKLPENERARLKKLLKEIVPDAAGVIVRTAAEGASDEELRRDVQRLQDQWAAIEKKAKTASAPALLQGEPDLAIRVVRDIFNDDFSSLVVQGDDAWSTISEYVEAMAPDLSPKVSRWSGDGDVFAAHRIDEQLAKGMDRKVWLPSGGSLVIDRTEAMTVVDVNTGKFTGSGGTLEETVTRNNLEAAEEIVRQLRLRDIGGIIVIDFIDMVLESNRDLVLRRLVECLGRDRTKHQVAEVTSLGLVQMTRKRVGQGLVEAFSETCEHCNGRGFIVHTDPIEARGADSAGAENDGGSKRSRRKKSASSPAPAPSVPVLPEAREAVKATLATIAAAAAHAHEHDHDGTHERVGLTEVTDRLDAQAQAQEQAQAERATGEPEPTVATEVPEPAEAPEAATEVPEPAEPTVAATEVPEPTEAVAEAELADVVESVEAVEVATDD